MSFVNLHSKPFPVSPETLSGLENGMRFENSQKEQEVQTAERGPTDSKARIEEFALYF